MRLNTGPHASRASSIPSSRPDAPVAHHEKILPSAGARALLPQPIDAQAFGHNLYGLPLRSFRPDTPRFRSPCIRSPPGKIGAACGSTEHSKIAANIFFCVIPLPPCFTSSAHSPRFPRDAKRGRGPVRAGILERIISKALPASGGQMCRSQYNIVSTRHHYATKHLFFLFLIFPEKDMIIRQETTATAISPNATTD